MAWWGPSPGPRTLSPVLSAPYLVAQAGFVGMPPVCSHRVPTWFNDWLLLSWNFLAFLKKGTHILIFHWTPQIIWVLPVLLWVCSRICHAGELCSHALFSGSKTGADGKGGSPRTLPLVLTSGWCFVHGNCLPIGLFRIRASTSSGGSWCWEEARK